MTQETELPALPEPEPAPVAWIRTYSDGSRILRWKPLATPDQQDTALVTADQMRAYAAAAVLAERERWRVALGACDAALSQCQPCAEPECGAEQREFIRYCQRGRCASVVHAASGEGWMMDDLVQRLRYMADDEAPIDMTASETARQAADELDRREGRALSAEAEIERLRAQLAERDLELRKANIKLRDRAHPASEPRDPPEVLASLGFWPDCGCGECYAIHCLGNALAQLAERKMAPVQGYAAGIPWSLHLEAYDAYVKRHGRQQALIEGGCRGGFGTRELDDFIPGWRERVSEIVKLRAQLAERDMDAARYFAHEFEVWQDDVMVASASGPRDDAMREVMHYAMVYGQDGPVRVFEVTRTAIDAEMAHKP